MTDRKILQCLKFGIDNKQEQIRLSPLKENRELYRKMGTVNVCCTEGCSTSPIIREMQIKRKISF